MQTRAPSHLVSLLLLFVSGLPAAFAARAVRVYEIEIHAAANPAAIGEAMRAALVRATGSRESAADPALSMLVTNAARYVQATRPAGQGASVVVFDGAAIERDIAAAGRTVWRRDRPFVLVTLQPQPAGPLVDSTRRTLEQVAEARGLPVSVVPASALDPTGAGVATPSVLRSAQRLGADAVLVGEGDNAALNGQWRWSLYSDGITQDFSGSLEAGVNGAADQLALAEKQQTSAGGDGLALIQIDGVNTLTDYAGAARALEALPGVQRVQIRDVTAGSATYQVLVRGGAQSLTRALASSSALQESGSDPARLVYHYKR